MAGRVRHEHPEAFCMMAYQASDGETEYIWNSRDGVTPYVITLRSGKEALKALCADLIRDPLELRMVVVFLDIKKLTTDMDSGDVTPTARVRRIEPITRTDDIGVVQRIMMRAHEERTGKTVLPYDLEWSVRGAFDPNTGELK